MTGSFVSRFRFTVSIEAKVIEKIRTKKNKWLEKGLEKGLEKPWYTVSGTCKLRRIPEISGSSTYLCSNKTLVPWKVWKVWKSLVFKVMLTKLREKFKMNSKKYLK